MNEQEVRNAFKRLRIKATEAEAGWLMSACPFAKWKHAGGSDSTPSFGVSFDERDPSYYHCFTCKSKGPLPGLAFALAKLRPDPALMEVGKQLEREEILGGTLDFGEWEDKYHIESAGDTTTSYRITRFPPRSEFLSFPSAATTPEALDYLSRRRIPYDTVIKTGLRFDERRSRILFPVLDYWTGRYVGCTGRITWSEARRKRVNTELEESGIKRRIPKVRDYSGLEKRKCLLGFYGRADIPVLRRARPRNYWILCEGLFAYLRLVALGFGDVTLAILGTEITEEKAYLLRHSKRAIYWFTDPDQGGWQCLFGTWDVPTEKYKGGGALEQLLGDVAQFIPHWPEGLDDIDDLESADQVEQMMDKAELVTRKFLTGASQKYTLAV